MIVFDSHLDFAWNATEWRRNLRLPVAEIREAERGMKGVARGTNTVSLPALRAGHIALFLGTLLTKRVVLQHPPFIPFERPERAKAAALEQLTYYRNLNRSGELNWILDGEDLSRHLDDWQSDPERSTPGFILSMEGADPVLNPDELPEWWQEGLRVIGPVHYGENQYGFGTGSEGGLKPQGLLLLEAMQREGMILDITHLTDTGFDQALTFFSGPVLASHHNCRSLVPGERQLADEQIKRLIRRNAVIGVAFDAWMLQPDWVKGQSKPPRVGLEAVVDHIDHICQLAGDSEHVGIGSDLDGGFGTEQSPRDLDTIADVQKLSSLLARRGFSSEAVERVLYQNWVDFFSRCWTPA